MLAPSSQPSTVVGGGVVQVVHQAWTALLLMCPASRWHNALPLMPSTEARLGCAPLSSSMARPTFLMHGLSSLKSPAHRLDQHADTALVGSGTTSDVAGGAGCVEQTLATNELLLNHHASCKCKAEKRSRSQLQALVKVVVLPLSSTGITTSWHQQQSTGIKLKLQRTGRSQPEGKARCLNIGPCRTRGSDDQGQAQHGTRGEAQQPIEGGRGCCHLRKN